MYVIAELKAGRTIVLDGEPYLITWNQFSKQGRQGGVMATKLRNLKTGNIIQRTFQGNDKLEPADTGFRKVQYLYCSGDAFTFMDLNSYDQFELGRDVVGEGARYLVEGQEVDALVFGENPIGIQLPPTVNLQVAETPPGVKGDTATGGTKFAELENGTKVAVPLFINAGDRIKVNTETGVYMERV